MSEDYEFLNPVDGDDGFFDPSDPPVEPGPEANQQTEQQQTQQSQQQAQEADEGKSAQTEADAQADQPTYEHLKPFMNEDGTIRIADLDAHLKATRSMTGRQANEIGKLRAMAKTLEATRGADPGKAGSQQQQQQQQQQSQEKPLTFSLPENYKGLLQGDDLQLLVHVIKEIVGSGASSAVRGELGNLAKESEQYQERQATEALEIRRSELNTSLGQALEHVGSFSETYMQIPPKVIYDEVMNDPEIQQRIQTYLNYGDKDAFNPEIAHNIALTIYQRLAQRIEATASAHLQSQSGPQNFSPKVIPVKPTEQTQQQSKYNEIEKELLGSFAGENFV